MFPVLNDQNIQLLYFTILFIFNYIILDSIKALSSSRFHT